MSAKKCRICETVKALEEFSKNRGTPDGLQYRCKVCARLTTKAYGERNKARNIDPSCEPKICGVCKALKQSNEYGRNARNKDGLQTACKACTHSYLVAYHEQNKANAKVRNAANYAGNKEARNAASRQWRESNKERAVELGRAYYQQNKDRLLEKSNERYQGKGEEIRARLAAYRAANPETRRAIDARMRAKRKSAPGSHTAADISKLMKLQRGKCIVCKCDIRNSYHVDHIEPLARGGSNDRDNLQLLCPPCNKRKHARDPIEFMNKQGFLL